MNPNNQQPIILMPQFQQHQGGEFLRPRDPVVPPRVRLAMELLNRLTDKTAAVPMGTYSSERVEFTPVPGQKLTVAEEDAQHMACDVLKLYFAGTLPESPWDKPEAADQDAGLTQLKIRCPNCQGIGSGVGAVCDVCNGAGQVLLARVDAPIKRRKRG